MALELGFRAKNKEISRGLKRDSTDPKAEKPWKMGENGGFESGVWGLAHEPPSERVERRVLF